MVAAAVAFGLQGMLYGMTGPQTLEAALERHLNTACTNRPETHIAY